MNKNDLIKLRQRYEQAVVDNQSSADTAKRYKLWIRRYLRYLRHHGLEIGTENVAAFLTKNEYSISTQRQGYFALEFLFLKVVESKVFPALENIQTSSENHSRAEKPPPSRYRSAYRFLRRCFRRESFRTK